MFNSGKREVTRTKAFLSELLLYRCEYKGPNGKPLYTYQLNIHEYEDLEKILRDNKVDSKNPVKMWSWSACFCLYVAESFRRKYDASGRGWSWAIFESPLAIEFSPAQRKDLVIEGLKYWKREIKHRSKGMDLLGTLFSEGGLPWKLLQSDTHGFGRAVRGGLKQFYRIRSMGSTTTSLMEDYQGYFPCSFKNIETRQLLAGIIEQLIHLVETHPLSDNSDPASYLDENAKAWRNDFPIPISEENGRNLINEWLKDAEQRRVEKKEVEAKKLEFTCSHKLVGSIKDWKISTQLFLPREHSFEIDPKLISSTRLELGFYEGGNLLAKGGVVYGSLENNILNLRFPSPNIPLNRQEITEPVILKLLDGGRVVHSFHFENSALELVYSPLIFENDGSDWQFVANASCIISDDSARIRLPESFLLPADIEPFHTESNGAVWIDIQKDLSVCNKQDAYSFKFGAANSKRLQLSGKMATYSSSPQILYFGKPKLVADDDYHERISSLKQFANGELIDKTNNDIFGTVRYGVKNKHGDTLLRRRFGILPEGFKVSLYPATSSKPAKLIVRSPVEVELSLASGGLHELRKDKSCDSTSFTFEPKIGIEPTQLNLLVAGKGSGDPVELRFPYPDEGVKLIDENGLQLQQEEIQLNNLLGKHLLIINGGSLSQRFYLKIELMEGSVDKFSSSNCARDINSLLKKEYFFPVGSSPEVVNLFAFTDDISHMLAAVSNQDCFIRLSVEAHRPMFGINIRRFNGEINHFDRSALIVTHSNSSNETDTSSVAAMLLSDPKQHPIQLIERTSNRVGLSVYQIPHEMDKSGPWLVYPEINSSCYFRPLLHIPTSKELIGDFSDVNTLHNAAELFHPSEAPDLIDRQIEKMAMDLNHTGWQYLDDMRLNYSHLPLSTFECWKSLANHQETLTIAIFRMDVDETFCKRIRDELAVIWETIPLPLWVQAFKRFKTFLTDAGMLSDVLINSVISNRKEVLPEVVPGFEHLGNYLESGDVTQLQKAPVQVVLPMWYQDLRRRFADATWPDTIGSALYNWILKRSDIPKETKELTDIPDLYAVTYLPIFMAYVSTGKAALKDLDLPLPLLKFAIRLTSDFDFHGWYRPCHSMITAHLLTCES